MKQVFVLLLSFLLTSSTSIAVDLASEAAPGSDFSVADGFQVERIYSVPSSTQGSWVSMTVDDFGRLITSDQNGKLYRVSPPSISGEDVIVEPIDLKIGRAQGLLCAFGSLYVMAHGNDPMPPAAQTDAARSTPPAPAIGACTIGRSAPVSSRSLVSGQALIPASPPVRAGARFRLRMQAPSPPCWDLVRHRW